MHRFLVNAGIYVLEPEAVDLVPNGSAYDMPTLFEEMARRGVPPSVFPIREYWLDIGRIDDFNKANDDYVREFRTSKRKAISMIGGATVLALIPARGGLERRAGQEHPASRRQAADRLDDRGREGVALMSTA